MKHVALYKTWASAQIAADRAREAWGGNMRYITLEAKDCKFTTHCGFPTSEEAPATFRAIEVYNMRGCAGLRESHRIYGYIEN